MYHVLNIDEGGEETEVVRHEHRIIQLALLLCYGDRYEVVVELDVVEPQ